MFLLLRNNTHHFRFVIPPHLRSQIGKREIRKSLQTGNKREAQRQALILAGQVYSELNGYKEKRLLPVKRSKQLINLFDMYISERRLQGAREHTILTKRSANHLKLPCPAIE